MSAPVSVVVCSYDMARWEQLLACLDSLHQQTLPPQAVVVVVDGCPDLVAALRERGGSEIITVHEVNQGISAARNTGVAQVTTRWVAFLDDDATADPTWLERLVTAAEELGAAGAGGRSEPVFDQGMPCWFPPELLWTVGCSFPGMPRGRTVERLVFGGCSVLDTELFERFGGYDVTLGRRGRGAEGGEEADFSLRIAARSPERRFVHVPDAIIHHRVGSSRLTRRYVLHRCYSDGRTKSLIARRSGMRGLHAERTYLTSTVPRGVARHLRSGRWQAALVLMGGVGCAGAGYLTGRFQRLRPRPGERPGDRPGERPGDRPGERPERVSSLGTATRAQE
ncbi:MAG: glycosyltransferase family 2 protein [Micromonosporaceae bacterium]|nr:glycosyltransferase family 2 protein [Micromonosporaceae bacterium]